MPGKPRMYLPVILCHVIQRGNSRYATFFAEESKGTEGLKNDQFK